MAVKWGLRGKSALAVLLACAIALVPAVMFGWRALGDIRGHFGEAYARNFTLLHRQQIAAPLSRELALSKRLANSLSTRQWLQNESSSVHRTRFFDEAEGFRSDFLDKSYFIIVDSSLNFYRNDESSPVSQIRRYTLSQNDPADAWYFALRDDPTDYSLGIEVDEQNNASKIRFNVRVRNAQNKLLGITGSELNLKPFIDELLSKTEPGVMPMLFNHDGIIQAQPKQADAQHSNDIFDYLSNRDDRQLMRQIMLQAQTEPNRVKTMDAMVNGKPRLLALAYIEPLRWYVMTSVDLQAANVVDSRWLWLLLISFVALLAVLLLGFAYAVESLVVRPIKGLRRSALAIAAGHYEEPLPDARDDEIGELTQAFSSMADQVLQHTRELEGKVQERTQALEQANREMVAAHKKIDDSIDYASLIQRAILPDRQLSASLGQQQFVLWQPRDTVGGDFYVYRQHQDGYLLGVFDCAGHGVPGALMTMLARAAIDHAIGVAGADDPAAILRETDLALRGMLADAQSSRALATNTDAGLVWVNPSHNRLLFAGAKIGLFATDGEAIQELPGGRRALGDKRKGEYQNIDLALMPGWTYYMCTDGFLDQAGGEHGFGFGNKRFTAMLQKHAKLPLAEQAELFATKLAEYQGELPQRDDITVLCFRFDQNS